MKTFLYLTILLGVLISGDVASADWPQLRGPRVDGRSRIPSILTRVPNAQLKLRWKRKLGKGYSSVSTSGSHAVTAFDDGRSIYLASFAIDSGSPQWQTRIAPHWTGQNGSYDGPIATPALGFGKAFILTPEGRFTAVDLESGKIAWSIDLVDVHGVAPSYYGFGASPTLSQHHVLLPLGPPQGAIGAFDPDTGKLEWSLGEDKVGYQTPAMMSIDGTELLLCAGETQFFGIDLLRREVKFQVAHQGEGGRGAWSLAPVPLSDNEVFLAHDDTRSKLIRINTDSVKNSKRWNIQKVWQTNVIRNSYNVPVFAEDHLFAFGSRILTCLDENGNVGWRSRKPGDGFISEVDDHLAILTKTGSLHLVDADPKHFHESSRLDLFEDTSWSIPAIDGDAILVRSMNEIACIEMVAESSNSGKPVRAVKPGQLFQAFLDRVEASTDKQSEVDRFMTKHHKIPLIQDGRIHFLLQGDYQDVAVGSDLFGARQERTMTRVAGTDLFYLVCDAPKNARLGYFFIADFQSIVDPRNPNTFESSVFVEDLELAVLVKGEPLKMSWFETGPSRKVPQLVVPLSQQEPLKFISKSMNQEINATVLKPSTYSKDGPALPVVYFHGGKQAIDQGNMSSCLNGLMVGGRMPPALIVFIHCEYDPTVGAVGYEEMVGEELIPLVESRYNVDSDRKSRSSVGGGFFGVLALHTGLRRRKQFGNIGVFGLHHFHVHRKRIGAGASGPGPKCNVVIQTSPLELRNPDENWNMSVLAAEVVDFLKQHGHDAELESTRNGTDWICWRLGSESMFKRLLTGGHPK